MTLIHSRVNTVEQQVDSTTRVQTSGRLSTVGKWVRRKSRVVE